MSIPVLGRQMFLFIFQQFFLLPTLTVRKNAEGKCSGWLLAGLLLTNQRLSWPTNPPETWIQSHPKKFFKKDLTVFFF